MEIIIHPLLTGPKDNTLNDLVNDISRELEGIRVILAGGGANNTVISSLKKHAKLQSLFNTSRNQWDSPKLLDWLYNKLKPNKDRTILVILDIDAYSDGLNFVLGEVLPKGGLGAVYLARIKDEFYGLKPNDKLFYHRMVKECVHELGHLFGFVHCRNIECVMHFSNTLGDTDLKGKSFCKACRTKSQYFN